MKTIDKFLKESRLKKRYSVATLAKETKIKREFLKALESQNWEVLPDIAVIRGFVKSIASVLGVSEREALALLRRDYPPKEISVAPKPDLPSKLLFGPRIAFILGTLLVLALVLGYLFYQYLNFIRPPSLLVTEPEEGKVIQTDSVLVRGKTDTDAVVEINNQPILLNQDGGFEIEIKIFEGTKEVIITATSRAGKVTQVNRKIDVQLGE